MDFVTAVSAPWARSMPSGAADASGRRAMDADSFAAFHARTSAPLLAYARRLCGDASLAEDVSQEAYLRFLQAPLVASGERALKGYLYRIATNLVTDLWRRRRFERRLDSWLTGVTPSNVEASSPAAVDVARAMARLRPRERALLWLAHVDGFDHAEIARIVGLAPRSVRVALFRSRRKLAKQLERASRTAQ